MTFMAFHYGSAGAVYRDLFSCIVIFDFNCILFLALLYLNGAIYYVSCQGEPVGLKSGVEMEPEIEVCLYRNIGKWYGLLYIWGTLFRN